MGHATSNPPPTKKAIIDLVNTNCINIINSIANLCESGLVDKRSLVFAQGQATDGRCQHVDEFVVDRRLHQDSIGADTSLKMYQK